MPRPKGSKNKKTLLREAEERAAVAQQGPALLPAVPFSETEAREQITEAVREGDGKLTASPTIHAATAHCEYLAPSGERWRIENGQQLLVAFSLEPDELSKWHEAMAPEKNVWHILRSHYAIAPLTGESNAEYIVPRALEDIGKPLGLDAAGVQGQVDAAKAFWVRWKMANASRMSKPEIATPAIPDDEVETLLKKYGFGELEDANKRQYAAGRLKDFKHKLEDEEGGSLPPQAIRLELQMGDIDKVIDRLAKTAGTTKDDRDEMSKWMNMRDKLSDRHLSLMEALNSTQAQNPSVQRKVAFIDCLGTLIKAVQEYEARGDRLLIDGIHDAGDIEFLVTPTSLRPAQYRPDLVYILKDALKHENLWNPEYIPPTLERGAHRRLLKGFQEGTRAMMSEQGGIPEMEDEETAVPVVGDDAGSMEHGGPSRTGTASDGSGGLVQSPGGAAAAGGFQPMPRSNKKAGNEFVVG